MHSIMHIDGVHNSHVEILTSRRCAPTNTVTKKTLPSLKVKMLECHQEAPQFPALSFGTTLLDQVRQDRRV